MYNDLLESGTDGCNRQPGRSTQICEITWDLTRLKCRNLVHYECKHTVLHLDNKKLTKMRLISGKMEKKNDKWTISL